MKNILLIFFLFPTLLWSQKSSIIKGFVKDSDNNSIENVSVKFGSTGTTTNSSGFYQIRIPLNTNISLEFSHVGFKSLTKEFFTKKRNIIRFSPVLILENEVLEEVVIKNETKDAQGVTTFKAKDIERIPGANSGIETLLMTMPGVSNNNELSTQYNVRGGNFDENLVYVNGIEIYRPFLVRSGQQEGLSFVNSTMVQNINFSAGGFQAKYGDKLSSVLDITYRKPTEFSATVKASLLGSSITVEDVFLDNALTAIVGVRYRDNSLFVNSKQIETNFKPRFTDIQTFLTYKKNEKLSLNFLGNFSLNTYDYQPVTRRTRFGTVSDPLELIVFYDGQEKDTYLTAFGALSANYQVNDNLELTSTLSAFNTQEEEYFDIAASYNLGEVDSNIGSETFGDVTFSEGIGSQLNHSRNDLDALITNVQVKGTYKKNESQIDFGIKYQIEDIKDRIREWEIIDSVGFSVRPLNLGFINDQPYNPYSGPIEPFQNIRAENKLSIKRLSGFFQYSKKGFIGDHKVWWNLGVRGHLWSVNANQNNSTSQFILSPRAQFAIKPNWDKDMLFRVSGGVYAQPPFYKELRNFKGEIIPNIKAQKSIHMVLGNDYSFTMWDRPFKLTTELYFKNLSNINPYSVDNVRIRYQANNNAKGYATGIDVRLNGEFVPGNESWVSLGILKTEENINNRGYIARPSDQRFKLGILFQDYVPNLPDLKAYLNLVYNSGVPGGAPSYADPYNFQNRLRDYRRADLGVLYIFTDAKKRFSSGFLSKFKEFTAGLELFNMFDIQNSITNTWVRDAATKNQFGVPNYLSGRILNLRIGMKF
ncbi:TonB-dependent receptor plug domain-containing protein [Flavobacteriaceae bacterium]|nr:TonB-dependent receptor plug domain-containing protein [Flavobacteriaceae bacterium]MDB2658672.1 TonB-dependent receptor plug domain-containing protein [Flavobacteriaceae bacterium]